MGIIKTARDDISADVAAFKAASSPNRTQKRKYLAALSDAVNELINKHDAQDVAAPVDFAASKQSQFDTYVGTLPEPTLNPVDPNS